MEIKINVNHQTLKRSDCNEVVSESINYLRIKFYFTDDWTGLKTVLFKHSLDETIYQVILDDDNSCLVPHEVIKDGSFDVSVFCGFRITSNSVRIEVIGTMFTEEGAEPENPTPSVYEQLITIANETKEIAQSVRDDADNGKFNGEKGEQGEKGEDGKNGIDGVNGKDATINGYNAVQIVGEGSVEVETVDNVIKIKSSGGESADLTEIKNEIEVLKNTKADKSEIPTKTSDLLNDSRYITSSSLSGYATTEYVNNAINSTLSGISNTLDAINGEIV